MIVCAGESLVDILPASEGSGPDRVVPGGGPMNAAVAASRLGAPTAFIGRVSSDAHGELIWEHLRTSGVDLSAAQRGPEPTARAIVTIEPTQSFRFEGTGTADESMTEVDLSPLGEGVNLLHAGTLGVVRGDTALTLGRLRDRFAGIVSFDPNIRPQVLADREAWFRRAEGWIDRADLVKASDEDLDWMGMSAQDLLDRGAAVVLKTLGADGVETTVASGESFTVRPEPVEVVDTVGAGDSFCGAILAQLSMARVGDRGGLDAMGLQRWRPIVAAAVEASSVTVSRPGADPPWRSELGGLWEDSGQSLATNDES